MADKKQKLPALFTQHGCWSAKRLHLTRDPIGHHIVRLQPLAMRSLHNVVDEMGDTPVSVISSFRSCADQRRVCSAMPGCSPEGCPGRCAKPGLSYHQLGLAVDIAPPQKALARRRLRRKFYANGWHNFSSNDSLTASGSDPWHFSYRVTG